MNNSKTLIIMPAFNEASSISKVLQEIEAQAYGADVLVVDDGSSDETSAIANKYGVNVLTLPFNLGVGGAMRAGFRYARANSYSSVVQLDSDGQHDPIFIPELVGALATADIVIGARFAGKGTYSVAGPRKWAMNILSLTLSRVCKTKLTDTTSGFKAIGPKGLELFSENYPAEYLGDTVEALVIASRARLSITQVPVEMRLRSGGEPSQSPIRLVVYLGRAFIAIFVGLSKKSKRVKS